MYVWLQVKSFNKYPLEFSQIGMKKQAGKK